MILILLISTLLIAACIFLITAPFFKKEQKLNREERTNESHFSIDAVYTAVNEMEMDLLMGKITAEDFQSIKESYYRLTAETIENKNSSPEDTQFTGIDREINEALNLIREGVVDSTTFKK